MIINHSEHFKELFCCEKTKVSAMLLENLFKPQLAEPGSNRRNTENRILTFWRDFLLDCEGE